MNIEQKIKIEHIEPETIQFSPNGLYLAYIYNHENESYLCIWNWQKKEKVRETKMPAEVTSLKFSPDEKKLFVVWQMGKLFHCPMHTLLISYEDGVNLP